MAAGFDVVTEAHFHKAGDRAAAQQLFKDSVIMVEIEVFSFCNRRCWFCPNSQIDRRSGNTYMSPTLYTGILQQLEKIDYSGAISYSRYNEPLADRVILERLREGRATLPHVSLHTNSNGDYLTFDYLEELYEAGLRSLNIQIYLQNEQRYDRERMRERMAFIIHKLGLPSTPGEDTPDQWIESRLTYKDMSLRVYGRNFEANGCSRGETLDIRQDYVRTAPCILPFNSVYIDYNGKMMPCCNLRSDAPQHKEYVVFDLAVKNDIFAGYAQSALVNWRGALVGVQEKAGVCKSCFFPYHISDLSPEEGAIQEKLVAWAHGSG